jgi:RHS repeat-associated protein
VWDPISDQLAAIFEAEKYEGAQVVVSGRPLRQFIHGGMGLDDPIEVAVADASVTNGVQRYYPVLDEAGTSSLQAVIGESGQLLARNLPSDPFNQDPSTIAAPTADKVTISGTKDATGAITQVTVQLHLTEPLSAATLAGGTRLASVTTAGAVAKASSVVAVASNPYTLTWTIPASDWTALTTAPAASALSVAITNTLRSTTFGPDVPFSTDATQPGVFTSAALPFELREPLANVLQQSGVTFTMTPYAVTSLSTLARTPNTLNAALVLSPFKAHLFADSLTAQDYVRARWLDRASGTWLTPDPRLYRDSSDLYSFCGGDPANRRDASGLDETGDPLTHSVLSLVSDLAAGDPECRSDPTAARCTSPYQKTVGEARRYTCGISRRGERCRSQ